jgi:hypothetical protein
MGFSSTINQGVPLAIFMDRPNGDGWAHLVSDLDGESGRLELMDFGRKIGLARRIHRDNTYAKHYDIRGSEIERARKAGAGVVSRRELGNLLRCKKTLEGRNSSAGLSRL